MDLNELIKRDFLYLFLIILLAGLLVLTIMDAHNYNGQLYNYYQDKMQEMGCTGLMPQARPGDFEINNLNLSMIQIGGLT